MGYSRAGYAVVGVDIEPQPRYPFDFVQADMVQFAAKYGRDFDLIHAGPPCQRWSSITKTAGAQDKWPDLIGPLREILREIGRPYVIENVPGAPLNADLMLCGTMFGLNVIRHRLFECNPPIRWPPQPCRHLKKVVKHGRRPDRSQHYAAVTGHFSDVAFAQEAMGIDWLGQEGLRKAIPPAYTEYTGRKMMSYMEAQCAVTVKIGASSSSMTATVAPSPGPAPALRYEVYVYGTYDRVRVAVVEFPALPCESEILRRAEAIRDIWQKRHPWVEIWCSHDAGCIVPELSK